MKTDKFDEAFRRKVENFHPPFSEDEIDRVQGYVNQHIPLSLWQRFGHIFTYSVGTLMILTLLTTTLYKTNENKALLNKISELNKQLTQQPIETVVKGTSSPVIVEKIDTVYVVKHIKHEITINDYENMIDKTRQSNAVNNAETSENTVIHSEKKPAKTSPNIAIAMPENELINENNLNKNFDKKANTVINKSKKTGIKTSQNDTIGISTKAENTVQNIISENVSKTNQSTDNQTIINEKNINNQPNLNTESPKSLLLKDLKSKGFYPLGLSPAISFADRQLKTARWVGVSSKKSGFRMPQISLPLLKYRVGLGSNIDNGQIGTSILTEVLFSKRWSMTTGLNVSFLGFEHFGDEDDFKRRTEQDFREQHDLDLPLSSPIKDIEAHQVLFRIPLYLNYRLPLRKEYTAIFSTGTDFDVNLRQITSFSHHDFIKENQQEGVSEQIKVTPFNNWMLSAGIEKRWKRFSVQISPYVSYQLKPLTYRTNDWMFGLKFNSFYRLK